MKVAVIGGGAAGFFAAVSVKENYPRAHVSVIEKTNRVLSKVKISGGGRCNVTNGEGSVSELAKAYPRGGNALKKAFGIFGTADTVEWFRKRGVALITQDDNCVFPESQSSQTIIDCFLTRARILGIDIQKNKDAAGLNESGGRWTVRYSADALPADTFDKVIVATGGNKNPESYGWLARLGHDIEPPVPSLFTFNMPDEPVRELQGITVEHVIASIQGTNISAEGVLLITHWGMSGPVVLKLSSSGARYLHEAGYESVIRINWTGMKNSEAADNGLKSIAGGHAGKSVANIRPFSLPDRLWRFLIGKCDIPASKRWGELGKKDINKLVSILTNDTYETRGKTAFREEFVTCGGVSLSSVDMKTMQSKVCPNLYFAGEVLDIDGITGGYNFQAAWTTGFIAGKLL